MKQIVIFVLMWTCVALRGATISWTTNQSPVILTNDFEVPPNDTLLIQAGVVVVSSQPPNRRYILPYEDSTNRNQQSWPHESHQAKRLCWLAVQ